MESTDYKNIIKTLKPFCKKDIKKAVRVTVSTVFMLYLSIALSIIFSYQSIWYSLFFIPITTIFLCRHFVLLHDACHESLFRKKWANIITSHIFALPIFIPSTVWKYIHDQHHMNVGNLDKRNMNPEIWTLTLKEYQEASLLKKYFYTFFRSAFVRFFIAPFIVFGVIFRIPIPKLTLSANISILVYDIIYTMIFIIFIMNLNLLTLFISYLIPLMLFFIIASYIFYAQHQFEDTYWEKNENWSFEDAAYKSSTYLLAPKWANWISGNVGYHHIHHLISGIPYYNLEKAQIAISNITSFKPISIFKIPLLTKYKVWDEESKKLIRIP